jgi:hypothetical protein
VELASVFEGWVAGGLVAGAVGSIAGGVISGDAAKSAANTQANAANNAQQISEQEFNTITQQEQPFMNAGYGALSSLNQGLGIGAQSNAIPGAPAYGSLNAPFTLDDFHNLSPAYQFQQQQGMQGVLNSDAAGQGALSGAASKDLIGFNQNLANTSFNNAFNQYQTQNQNIYNRLSGIATLGQNAASNTGTQGTALAGQAAQSATNVGTAQAAGTIGAANAASGALSNLSALPWLYGQGGGGGGGGFSSLNSGDWVNQLYGGG